MKLPQRTWCLVVYTGTWIVTSIVHANEELRIHDVCENSYSPKGLDKGILSWMHSLPGGYYNPKQEFRHLDPEDTSTLSGIFAREQIEEGELLCQVPWEHLIANPKGPIENQQLDCGLVRELARHLPLGKKSKFGPYIEYLNSQPENQLPSVWSTEGQELLLRLLGQTREENSEEDSPFATNLDSIHFPPTRLVAWMEEWYDRCEGDSDDTWGKKATLMALLRADDFIMIPAYDFYNHRNGEWHNADSDWEIGEYHETRASRTIEAGEQIYISYNRCPICFGRRVGYGTAEIFRDYGFVESFPQHWHYYNFNDMEFELHQLDGFYYVEWMKEPTENQAMQWYQWLQQEYRRLTRFWYHESNNQNSIPKNEWDMTWNFHHSNVVAIKCAIHALEGKNMSISEATIGTMDDMYCDLHQDDSWRSMDMENLVCDMREFDEYLPIDGGSSLHQAIQIYALDNDICLDRQQRVHVCSSFRPAYYEYFVHPAMSFLQKTRRVLIMGNGASFFLHEVLKYDIEYVLVLELDQTMMDMAQKHFGVDPHFDDPRVEWWFSDPREVLSLMDDWVSFDLVLADLPDSTLSSMNRDGRDLGDLVHKNGIFVSKKSQMERLGELFAFTSRWAYKLTPGCAQVLTWSSHSVDFAYAPVVDHNIDTVLYQASLMKENRFQLLHDFDRNIGESDLEERAVQDAVSLGMIQILEFVNATANLEETIYSSLHEHGLQILSTMTLSTSLVWRTTDGYIVSRQSGPYIGLDIHLAKNTSKVSALAATIADKLGSVQSSYRLVTNGIQMSQKHATAKKTSKSNEVTPSSMAGDASIVGDILSAITATMLPSPKHALVICETAHDCLSGSVMRNLRLVETHFVLEIPSIQQNRTDEVPLESMMVHEQQLQNWIQKTLIDTEIYIDSIFLDGSLSLRSLQLLDALLNIEEQNLEDWISKETLLVVLPTLMHTRKARRFVANQFQLLGETQNIRRKSHRTEFSAKADFVIAGRNATQRMEFSLVAQGRRNVSKALEALETTLTDTFRESELQVRIQQLQGGPLKSADLLQAQLFQQSDFNLVAEQDPTSPIGTQALIQIDAKNSGPVILDAFVADVTNALQALSIQLVQQRVVENAMIFDLDRGDLVIVIHHDTAIDLNLHLACTGDQCPMSDLYRFICHLTSWNREWELIFVDVFPRGPGKNLRFSSTPHIRQGLEACAQHNDEDNEDSAFDDVDSNGNVDHEKEQNDNEEQNDDEDEQNDDDEEHDEDEGEQNENKDEQKKDNEEQNDDEDEENNDDEDEENNDDEDEENNDDEDEENNDDEEDSENEGETFA